MGETPEGVVIDVTTRQAAVAVDGPPRLVFVDYATGEIRREVPLPGSARHLALSSPGGPILVPVESADVLVEVDAVTYETRTTKVGDGPHDVTRIGERIFTADEFGSTLSVVRDGHLVGQVPVDAQPGSVADAGGDVAVVAVRAYTVELYDGGSDEPRGRGAVSAGLGPSHVEGGDPVVVADTRGKALVVYDLEDRLRYARRIGLEGTPVGLASEPRGVWVTLTERNEAVLVDPMTGRVEDRVATVRDPFSLDEADGLLVIASQSEGTLQVVRPG